MNYPEFTDSSELNLLDRNTVYPPVAVIKLFLIAAALMLVHAYTV